MRKCWVSQILRPEGLRPGRGSERNVTAAPPGDQPSSQLLPIAMGGLNSANAPLAFAAPSRRLDATANDGWKESQMLELLRRSHRYVVGGIVVILAGVFIAYLGLRGPGSRGGPAEGTVVKLGDRHYF